MQKVLRVSAVKEGSQGEKAGLKKGDTILSYDNKPIHSEVQLSGAARIAKYKQKESVELKILRGEKEIVLNVNTDPLGIQCGESFEMSNTSSALLGGDYKTGVFISMIVSFAGWLVCAGAVILVITALENMGRMGAIAIGPGVGILIGGLLLVISGQATRALFDSANYTRQMLELAKQEKSNN